MNIRFDNRVFIATISVIFSAVLYAICIPCVKLLEEHIPSVALGGLLYLGAGIGLFLSNIIKKGKTELNITKKEIPCLIGVVALDITAITTLMLGIEKTSAANVSLLCNFELAATSFFALYFFKEIVSPRLFSAIILIISACIILSFEQNEILCFNTGSLLVICAVICWGLENNLTRLLSIKDTRQITMIKGLFSGIGSLILSNSIGEQLPAIKWLSIALILGFISYGISVSLYIFAQRIIGAVKTGAYYASAPFFGILFSLLILKEKPLPQFYIALIIMIIGSLLVIQDSFQEQKDVIEN